MPAADSIRGPDHASPRARSRRLRTALAIVGVVLVTAIAVTGLLVVWPVGVPGAAAAPNPAASYAEAVARYEAVAQREGARPLIPVCRSKLLTSGERTARAIVLFHGYTNCPQMFEQFGEELAANGFNVYIPLAPSHGEADREHSSLDQLTTASLMAYAHEAVDLAAGLGDRVTVLGLSGGGAVAAYLGQVREDVDLAVPIAPFFGLKAVPSALTPGLINLADVLPPIAWGIPESMASGSGEYAPYASLDNNSRAAAAYMRLGQMVLADAAVRPHRATRTVTVVNEADDTVHNGLADDLTARWRAAAPTVTGEHRFPASLALPHDLIGPDRDDQQTALVYPVLAELIGPP